MDDLKAKLLSPEQDREIIWETVSVDHSFKKKPGNLGMYSTVIDDAIVICGGYVMGNKPVSSCTRLKPSSNGRDIIPEDLDVGPIGSNTLLKRQFACSGTARNGNSTKMLVAQGNWEEASPVMSLEASADGSDGDLKLSILKDAEGRSLYGQARQGGVGTFIESGNFAGLLCVGGYQFESSEV